VDFSVTILGSSSALPTSDRYPTAHALNVHERFFLIDCGEGTQAQLRRNHFKMVRINHIFISHLHGDHVFGIFGLLSTMNLLGRKESLHIYGHRLLKSIIDDHLKYFGRDFRYTIEFHEVAVKAKEVIYENDSLQVEAFPLKHRISCYGYLFREKEPHRNIHKWMIEKYKISLAEVVRIRNGADLTLDDGEVIANEKLTYLPFEPRSYAFCSDTAFSNRVAEYVKDVDLIYHESTFTEELKKMAAQTGHSTAKQAGKVARLANAKKLIIGHFSSRYKDYSVFLREAKEEFPNVELANEGVTFSIELKRFKD
jgi:ribonuclease Z